MCLAEGAWEAQCHSTFAVHKPEVSTVGSKEADGMCDKRQKDYHSTGSLKSAIFC